MEKCIKEENILESISYYQNIGVPQFAPINFVLYEIKHWFGQDNFNLLGSIIIAQIPSLFSKYNIPLTGNDLILFVNPSDNVTNRIEVEKCIDYKTDNINILYQIEYLSELYEFYQALKKHFIMGKIDIDKMLKEEIINKYNYDFDKTDPFAYEKFKIYLGKYILVQEDINRSRYQKNEDSNLKEKILIFKAQ